MQEYFKQKKEYIPLQTGQHESGLLIILESGHAKTGHASFLQIIFPFKQLQDTHGSVFFIISPSLYT